MPCYHPLDARRSPGGTIGFKPMTPFDKLIKLPCGKCIGCHMERARQWAVRGHHESSMHTNNSFITLTIRPTDEDGSCAHQDMCTKPKSAPELSTGSDNARPTTTSVLAQTTPVDNAGAKTRQEGRGGNVWVEDHQLFMKRLLKKLRSYGPIKPIRFLMCGEYGGKKGRPHYHYILFGYDFPDKKYFKKKNGHKLYRSSLLEEVWTAGHADIGECNFETIAYVARYVTKKHTGPQPDGKNPEFNQMSRNPGLGRRWIEKYKTSVYPHDRVVIQGKRQKPPRYYDQVLKHLDNDQLELVKKERETRALQNSGNQVPERLRAGETIQLAALKQLKRSLE